jgi:hypothetical protein
MLTSPWRISGSLALLLITVACGDDVDPLDTAGTSITAASISVSAGPTSASASGASSASASASASSTGGETGGETDATTGGPTTEPTTGGGGGGSKEVCERYIQCVSVTDPSGLPSAQEGFGDDSNCWSGSPQDAELCAQACQTGLNQAHASFPDEEKCHACLSDADCDVGAGERCLLGGCSLTDCGDGLVDDVELCDGQRGCSSDCTDGAACSPLTNVGCSGSDICIINNGLGTECFDWEQYPDITLAGFNEGCDYDGDIYYQCEAGLMCISKMAGNISCNLDYCCMPLCDLAAPADCPNGFTCTSFPELADASLAEPALAYVGICLP